MHRHKGRCICQVAISGSELRRILIPRTPVNKGNEEGPGSLREPQPCLLLARSVPTASAVARVSPLHIGRRYPPTAPSPHRRAELPAGAGCSAILPALPFP